MSEPQKTELDSNWKIWEQYYKCRDFEIKSLWEKSVLLSAFLVLLLSGYGVLIGKLLGDNPLQWVDYVHINEACCALSILGNVISIIWIMMAKGSKAWYECYEDAIRTIEKQMDFPEEFGMHKMIYRDKNSLDHNYMTNKGGSYSPSKLNIVVGRIFMLTWSFIFAFHFFAMVYLLYSRYILSIHHIFLYLLFAILVVFPVLWNSRRNQQRQWRQNT